MEPEPVSVVSVSVSVVAEGSSTTGSSTTGSSATGSSTTGSSVTGSSVTASSVTVVDTVTVSTVSVEADSATESGTELTLARVSGATAGAGATAPNATAIALAAFISWSTGPPGERRPGAPVSGNPFSTAPTSAAGAPTMALSAPMRSPVLSASTTFWPTMPAAATTPAMFPSAPNPSPITAFGIVATTFANFCAIVTGSCNRPSSGNAGPMMRPSAVSKRALVPL